MKEVEDLEMKRSRISQRNLREKDPGHVIKAKRSEVSTNAHTEDDSRSCLRRKEYKTLAVRNINSEQIADFRLVVAIVRDEQDVCGLG